MNKRNGKRGGRRNGLFVYALLLIAALSFRVAVARFLPNDTPDDGKVYAQIARNVLEQHVYSAETEPPFTPTLIRLPGYPLFVAAVYSLFGHNDNGAVRIIQALIDAATCALIALVAFLWEPDEDRKRISSIAALALAVACPFTTIYVATILTETATMFLAAGMCLTATLAFKASFKKALWLWITTGLIAGVAVLFRPDSGLFALAIGITLVTATLGHAGEDRMSSKRQVVFHRTMRATYIGAVFSVAFCLVLVPWTIRNYRVFHLFQPLAPAHAEMPGEFVPRGYLFWLRTWIDDGRYVGPVLWSLDSAPIKIADIPDRAFDSADEKQRVSSLLEKYNHADEEAELFTNQPGPQNSPTPEGQAEQNETESDQADQGSEENGADDDSKDGGDEGDQDDENSAADQPTDQAVEMTPDIDAGFAQIARERISRQPLRYYVWLPLKRAHSLWFDTHSQYYPFEGDLLPLDELDYDIHQQYWLPLFAVLTLIYSLLGIAGAWFLWQTRVFSARLLVLLAALMIFLRIGFFATLENPEPRYVVEVFPFLSILGGIAIAHTGGLLKRSKSKRGG